MRPKATKIYNKTKVLYECPKCGASFRILETQEKYCHNCGIEIIWDVPIYLTQDIDESQEKEFLEVLNKRLETVTK